MIMLFNHRKSSSAMEQQMRSSEKTFVVDDIYDDTEIQEEMNEILPETIEITTQSFQKQDGKLTKLYNRINNAMLNAMQSREGERMSKFLSHCKIRAWIGKMLLIILAVMYCIMR